MEQAGSILESVIGKISLNNRAGRTLAVELIEALTEMDKRNNSWW